MLKSMPFLKEVGETLISDAYEIKIKIPTFFFIEPKLADDYGNRVSSMFIFDMYVKQLENSKERKFKIALPSELTFYYDRMEKMDVGDDKYNMYIIDKGTTFVDNINIVQSALNMQKVFNIISTAKLTEVEYDNVVDIFFDAAKINAANPGTTPVIFEAIVAELARYRKDVSIPFRNALGRGIAKADEYAFARITDLPKINSVFAGIGFEDITASVQSGVVKSEQNKPQNISRLEDIAKY